MAASALEKLQQLFDAACRNMQLATALTHPNAALNVVNATRPQGANQQPAGVAQYTQQMGAMNVQAAGKSYLNLAVIVRTYSDHLFIYPPEFSGAAGEFVDGSILIDSSRWVPVGTKTWVLKYVAPDGAVIMLPTKGRGSPTLPYNIQPGSSMTYTTNPNNIVIDVKGCATCDVKVDITCRIVIPTQAPAPAAPPKKK